MYAVIELGSHQYKVSEGESIEANKLKIDKGKNVTIDKILLFASGKDIRVGQPFLKDVKVTAKVIHQTLGDKVVAFKYRRRKGYTKKKGHRQKLTALNITKIEAK